jgi:hypothetical protein
VCVWMGDAGLDRGRQYGMPRPLLYLHVSRQYHEGRSDMRMKIIMAEMS